VADVLSAIKASGTCPGIGSGLSGQMIDRGDALPAGVHFFRPMAAGGRGAGKGARVTQAGAYRRFWADVFADGWFVFRIAKVSPLSRFRGR
jgi:hypothetical protein